MTRLGRSGLVTTHTGFKAITRLFLSRRRLALALIDDGAKTVAYYTHPGKRRPTELFALPQETWLSGPRLPRLRLNLGYATAG